MDKAIVKKFVAPFYSEPNRNKPQQGEVLFGMVVELLAPPQNGWCFVRTPCMTEAYMEEERLNIFDAAAAEWMNQAKKVVRAPWLDVMQQPDIRSPRVVFLPRAGLVHPLGAEEDGWLHVALPDARRGYVRSGHLMPHITSWRGADEKALREAVAAAALSYLGVQYRCGGSTPMGIDAAGLVSIACLMNGVVAPRTLRFEEGGDLHLIARQALAMGDVVYFEDHVGLYLGEGRFIHASPYSGSDAVVIDSLEVSSPFYQEELAGSITACASIF